MASGELIAVVGMTREAQILDGLGYEIVVAGGDAAGLVARLGAALAARPGAAVVSFGIAGGLADGVPVGDLIVASAVICHGERWACDEDWVRRLLRANRDARVGTLAGSDAAVSDLAGKRALWSASGALAVDMESHIAARMAAQAGRPFVAVRAISDAADHALPPAALVGLRPDGTADVGAVLTALAARPAQLPALIRTAQGAAAAYRTLEAVRDRLIAP